MVSFFDNNNSTKIQITAKGTKKEVPSLSDLQETQEQRITRQKEEIYSNIEPLLSLAVSQDWKRVVVWLPKDQDIFDLFIGEINRWTEEGGDFEFIDLNILSICDDFVNSKD